MRTKVWISKHSLILGIALFFVAMQLAKWPPLRFWGWWGGGNFLDSWQVLKSADCYREIGLAVYEVNNPCMLYAYGRPLLWVLSDFHLGASQTSAFGLAFIVILAIVLGKIIQMAESVKKYRIVITILIVTSPPILLLADRGNFDTIILAGLFLAQNLWKKKKFTLAILTVFIITLFKYYTLPLLILTAILAKSWRLKFLGALFFVISMFSIIRDLRLTQFEFSSISAHLTFGMGHEFLFFSKYESLNFLVDNARLLGLIEIIGLTLLFQITAMKFIDTSTINLADTQNVNFFFISLIIFLTCYISGSNADYRLVFFVPACLLLAQIFQYNSEIKSALVFCLVAALWLTFPSGDLEIVGDLLLSIFVSFNLAIVIEFSKLKVKKLFH
ncbi:hypothetical protein MCELANE86_00051 [Candidatus Nanopelagicaceae bacterium]